MDSLNIDIIDACDKWRAAMRNEKQAKELDAKWKAMGQTSTIERRLKSEINHSTPQISLTY